MVFFEKKGTKTFATHYSIPFLGAGLLMNILRVGDKLPVQQGFLTNSTGNLLPNLKLLGGLYNFCNLAIIFGLM